jgi:adenosylcobinamide-GDP ribazoletransferase
MRSATGSARALILAIQYFTRVPLPASVLRWAGFDAALRRASFAHFPGVGLLVGGLAAAAYSGLWLLMPPSAFAPLVAAALSTALSVLLTGALHEDGLADTADGLGAGGDRERMLEIMKDPSIGSFGAAALVMVLLAKVSLLALLGEAAGWRHAAAALLGAHVFSRGLAVGIAAVLPNIGSAGSKSIAVAGVLPRSSWLVALSWCSVGAALAAWLLPAASFLAAIAFAGAAWWWMRRMLGRRLEGFTGDCLGATQQLCELAFYFGAALALSGASV